MNDHYSDPLPDGATARLGASRLMHPDLVDDIVFSPDGSLVASCAGDIRIWDAATGRLVHRLGKENDNVKRLAFSPDGDLLASVSKKGSLTIWKVASGKRICRASLGRHEGRAVAFASNQCIVVGAYTHIQVFSTKGKLLYEFDKCGGWIKDLVCDAQRGRVYVATERELWRCELPTKKFLSWSLPEDDDHVKLDDEGPGTVALSIDGRRLVTSPYGKLKIWSVGSSDGVSVEGEHEFEGQANRICITTDGQRILTAGKAGAQLWSPDGELLRTFAQNHYGVDVVAIDPRENVLATGARGGDVRLWDMDGVNETLSFERHSEYIETLSFSAHADKLVTVAGSKEVRVWDADTGAQLHKIEPGRKGGTLVVCSPEKDEFAYARGDGRVAIYDLIDGTQTQELATRERSGWFRSIAYSPDGEHLVACRGDQELHCWRLGTSAPLWSRKLRSGTWSELAFTPDGKHLIACNSACVHVWSFPEGKPVSSFGEFVVHIVATDNYTIFGICHDRFARSWNLESGERLSQTWIDDCEGLIRPSSTVVALDEGSTTQFRAVPGLQALGKLGHGEWSRGATFSRDGKRFAAIIESRTVVVSNISDIVSVAKGDTPQYPGALALAPYELILNTLPAAQFSNVRVGDACTHECSPRRDDFLGIEINITDTGRILSEHDMDAMSMRTIDPPGSPLALMAGYISQGPDADIKNVFVVAINDETGQRYRGRLQMERPTRGHMMPMPEFDEDDIGNEPFLGTTGSWFTVNLSEFVGIPDTPAVYRVHLEHGVVESLKSDEVRIVIV